MPDLYGFPRPEARRLMQTARKGIATAANRSSIAIPGREVLNQNAYLVQPQSDVPAIDIDDGLNATAVAAFIVERDLDTGDLEYRRDDNDRRVVVFVCNLGDEVVPARRLAYAVQDTFGSYWIVETGEIDLGSSSDSIDGVEIDAACCAGTETALPGDDDCCPPGFVKISTKKFIDLVRFDGGDCNCETGSSSSGGSHTCGEEPSWANDPCDFTCFRFDPANIKNACANDCPCTADPIDAAALNGNPMTRYLAADLPEYPDGDESLITTTGEVYYTSGHWLWKQKTGSRYEFHIRKDGGQLEIIDCSADAAAITDEGDGVYALAVLDDEYTIEIDGCGPANESSSNSSGGFNPSPGYPCGGCKDDIIPATCRVRFEGVEEGSLPGLAATLNSGEWELTQQFGNEADECQWGLYNPDLFPGSGYHGFVVNTFGETLKQVMGTIGHDPNLGDEIDTLNICSRWLKSKGSMFPKWACEGVYDDLPLEQSNTLYSDAADFTNATMIIDFGEQ